MANEGEEGEKDDERTDFLSVAAGTFEGCEVSPRPAVPRNLLEGPLEQPPNDRLRGPARPARPACPGFPASPARPALGPYSA